MARLRLGVMISGRGSNLQALIDACQGLAFPAEIACVVSNVRGAQGIERARAAGIPGVVVPHKGYPDRQSFEADLTRVHFAHGVDLVCNAGFMRILTPSFFDTWADRVINIHPSLLPAFPGLRTHERAIAAGCRFSGCTVHFVRPEVDAGPIIVQAAVPVRPDDTPEALAGRVLAEEHRIYPLAIRWLAEGRVQLDGTRAIVAEAEVPAGALINPAG
ncbi:MAG: phosphoribosylglycinamide formyltransferase [Alphaproteobacteria bacterium]|nr:phosphoribosylglycinamide formyltransferase [Alphaproteobacteria bacterium]